jgi:sugar lactone lactonase YvrE
MRRAGWLAAAWLLVACRAAPTGSAAATPATESRALHRPTEAERTRTIGSVTVVFTIEDAQLLAEGLAYDAATGDFFVSSVHERKIVRVSPDGAVHDFVRPGQDGLLGVLGLAIDPRRRSLWALSSGIPESGELGPDEKGKAAVLEFDLANGALRERIDLWQPGRPHHFNDLTLDGEGHVYISDAAAGAIHQTGPGEPLEVWLPPGVLKSPQGLAWSEDGRTLFVADYARGLARIDRLSRRVSWLRADDAVLTGMDGLVRDRDGSLIATQNGLQPPRVIRIRVEGERPRVVTLLMNAPLVTEPTLGTIVGDDFVFVANAQWDAFAPGSKMKPRAPTIVRLRLR